MIILFSSSFASLEGSKLTANFETCLPSGCSELKGFATNKPEYSHVMRTYCE